LAVVDRDLPVAVQACGEIHDAVMNELGVPEDEVSRVHPWGVDVTNTDDVRNAIDDIAKKFGAIDILVCAAGTAPASRVKFMTRHL
jgi:NAD(P)-dependent dehydrogenase (short-subunit alcohol dehydrogenase family)